MKKITQTDGGAGFAAPQLITTQGTKTLEQLGLILPHEHIFVDLGPIEAKSYEKAQAAEVITLMQPELEKAREVGVTALVECTPVGVGRRVDIVKAVSDAATFPVVVATGIYREPWIPAWAHEATETKLYEWMLDELTEGIEETGVKAAWIKLSAGDDGITECETKLLRAAARAGLATGAVIGSHTIRGAVVLQQLDIIQEVGYDASRFIWIHTQAEPDLVLHKEVAERGAWLEFDALGSEQFSDRYFLQRLTSLMDAGFTEQLLLSHDRGWYDPSQAGGGVPKPFTYLSEQFLPKLVEAGFEADLVETLTRLNPFIAFAR